MISAAEWRSAQEHFELSALPDGAGSILKYSPGPGGRVHSKKLILRLDWGLEAYEHLSQQTQHASTSNSAAVSRPRWRIGRAACTERCFPPPKAWPDR